MHGVFQFLVISDPAFIEQVITERIEKLVASRSVSSFSSARSTASSRRSSVSVPKCH